MLKFGKKLCFAVEDLTMRSGEIKEINIPSDFGVMVVICNMVKISVFVFLAKFANLTPDWRLVEYDVLIFKKKIVNT